nr:MAG TPA: hypothetical protein [Caudoviricetes sp.]
MVAKLFILLPYRLFILYFLQFPASSAYIFAFSVTC